MKTTEKYIEDAKNVHGEKYDYTKVIYKGSKKKVCIICPEHGEFLQEANSHLKGCGCPLCAKEKNGDATRLSYKVFLERSNEMYSNKYKYNKSTFVDMYTRMLITCPIHGEFWQTPRMHLRGKGCPKCSKIPKYTTEKWVNLAKAKHNNKYDYSKVEYKNARTKVCIICPIHGEFLQTPNKHLRGYGCPECSKNKDNIDTFIQKAKKVHGNKYDYSNAIYVNSKTKLSIICLVHGEFQMIPNSHLSGQGCPKCGNTHKGDSIRLSKAVILERFKKMYKSEYSYEKWTDEHKSIENKIPIICKKHGIFYKSIHAHLCGQGCPKCQSSILENSIRDFLIRNKIEFEEQKTFEWLRYMENGLMRLDFYLPKYNIAIECQGEQHYKPIKMFGGVEGFRYQTERDKTKFKKCKENGIKVFYFSNKKFTDDVFTNKKELLKEIKSYE